MRRIVLLASSLLVLTAVAAGAADSPATLMQRMKTWLDPAQASTRHLEMTIRSGAEVTHWTAAQARATVDGASYALTVLLAPPDLRGTALLVREQEGQPPREWLYLPYLRRVREVLPVDEFESFLNTEFTYADMGFVGIANRDLKSAGKDAVNGVATVKVQEVPKDRRTFTKIITWLVPATGQPVKREFFDVANRLWKRQTFENAADIHGVPTVQRVRMEDVQTGYGSEYRVTDIAYGISIPSDLFDPAQLSKAGDHPLWK